MGDRRTPAGDAEQRVVLLCGGSPHAHDFEAIGDALEGIVAARGLHVERINHPEQLVAALSVSDVLVLHGLWWRMLGEAYDQWRDEHGWATQEPVKTALTSWLRDGGRLLAMHTAPICFDDWPGWADLLGAGWVWGQSSHPAPQPVAVDIDTTHPMAAELDATLEVVDEVYGDLAVGAEIDVVATAKRHADDADQPVVWTHRFGDGRVVCDLLGHDAASLATLAHRRLIDAAIDWIAA